MQSVRPIVQSVRGNAVKWAMRPKVKPNAKVRVFLFHHAGADGGCMFDLMKRINEVSELEAFCISMPGRGGRPHEAPCTHVSQVVEGFVENIFPLLQEKDYIFVGHSMGCAIAFYTALALSQKASRMPLHMILSSRHSIDHAFSDPCFTKNDEFFLSLLQKTVSAQILAEKELTKLLIKRLRSDFQINETCPKVPDSPENKLNIPFTVCWGGDADITHGNQQIKHYVNNWSLFTTHGVTTMEFGEKGGHLWIRDSQNATKLAAYIKKLSGI